MWDYLKAALGGMLITAFVIVAAALLSPKEFSPQSIVSATVRIETGGGLGSGTVISSNGLILTANHVVAGVEVVTVKFSNGVSHKGLVIKRDEENDVALIRIFVTDAHYASLRCDTPTQLGEKVFTIGQPDGMEWVYSVGAVAKLKYEKWMLLDMRGWFGNSGGGIFDKDGKLVGVLAILWMPQAHNGMRYPYMIGATPIKPACDLVK